MKKNKSLKMSLITSSALIVAILPITIVGCSKNNVNQEKPPTNNLEQEVARINSLNLSIKDNILTDEQINSFISAPLTFLDQEVSNWSVNPNFTYQAKLTNDQNKKQLKLIIEIIDNKDQTNKSNSKEFIFQYQNKFDVEVEVNKINNSKIELIKDELTQSELDRIDKDNFISMLANIEFQNIFHYEVINFQKTNYQFEFNLKIYKLQNINDYRVSKKFTLNYKIKESTLEDEIKRLNEHFKPELIKKDLTYQELLDINKTNLYEKITNLDFLDTKKFDYKIYLINKNEAKNSSNRQITFSFEVNLKGATEPPEELWEKNFTNAFPLKFNLIPTKKPDHKIEFDYLKDNKIDPVTTGQYYFSKPGGGIEQNSIIVSDGQGSTEPSQGVPKSGNSIKGFIYDEVEKRQLKNTFSLAFRDYSSGVSLGTGWILDYKLTNDNSYPTTWYIATNAHVIQNLKVPNDIISPERFEISNDPEEFYNTRYVKLKTVNNPQLQKEIPTLGDYEDGNTLVAEIPAINLKTIYIGLDYLYTTPSNFDGKYGRWQDTEEYADFAVMEVKFNDANEAKKMTQDYVNDSSRHFKYKKSSLLKDEVKKDYYSVIGFPDARGVGEQASTKVNLYTSRGADKNNKPINNDYSQLSNLATSPYYNSFNDKLGAFDGPIVFGFFGMDYRQAHQLTQWYNTWGLIYPVDYANLGPGSSGSMLMDKEGYTTGIHFAADPTATMGFAQSLYCEGFNYQGKFGSYNLEGYDLIEGGFPNQRTSYKDNLKRLYGANYKTKLFLNGI